MQVVHTLAALRAALRPFNQPAFVPTMGNLHAGHLALMAQAKPLGDVRVASIFVNRLQFAPHEDFDAYPRTLAGDCAALEAAGCDIVFAPSEAELYPQPQTFTVQPPASLGDILEGHFRPGFFTGVATVVTKLFNCVFSGAKDAGYAVFGEKDFQQLLVIRQLVAQLALPIEIVAGPIARASNGLALSSRNGYLSDAQREQAATLQATLQHMAQTLATNGSLAAVEAIEREAMDTMRANGWEPDYMTVRNSSTLLAPLHGERDLVVLGAAKLGSTRLIDNLRVRL
jgi:pantoate--beta-alanine ligase